MTEDFFKNRKMNPERLQAYGFRKKDGVYTWASDLLNGQFRLLLSITDSAEIKTQVIDLSSGDEYVLFRVPNAQGTFVGKVRDAYEQKLSEIAQKCFEPDVFKSEYAKKVIQYVRETYQDELEFLWKRFPENAIFRRKDNSKWYAALLVISKRKLGLNDDTVIEILDLRLEPETLASIVDGKHYFPGYHMNKQHWCTICLDGSVPLKEIFSRINDSYKLAIK